MVLRAWFFASVMMFSACGGSDGDDPPDTGELVGLGQLCVVAMNGADCPENASGCLAVTEQMGICSPLCVTGGTFMTNATGGVIGGSVMPNPADAEQVAICMSAFTGSIGTPRCTAIIRQGLEPPFPDTGRLDPDTTYTMASIACTIGCANDGACPGELRCNTALQQCQL